MNINVVCRNLNDDRVIPRFARYLRERNGWNLTKAPDPRADFVYLSGYFESQMCKPWPACPVGAYFTHREEEPPNGPKSRLFDAIGERVQLRVCTAQMYARMLEQFGPTATIAPPVERGRFTPSPRPSPARGRGGVVCGFSGYTYSNRRKGEDLVRGLLASKIAQGVEWRASGRGWPVPTRRYSWKEMPGFYQSLDVLICTSRVEGVPMPPLEALGCGVSIVIPYHVGLLDDLPNLVGIHRYERGDVKGLIRAVEKAVAARPKVDRAALHAATEPYTIDAWCEGHRMAIAALLNGFEPINAGIEESTMEIAATVPVAISDGQEQAVLLAMTEDVAEVEPVVSNFTSLQETGNTRGIYCVAFGDPARGCALDMMRSAKRHMPDIPIALCSDRKIGPEDVLIVQPDSDIGGRRAKIRAYELSPAEWEAVLYLDADTELKAPVYPFFEWIEDGWEFVICKDPHLMDTMHSFKRRNNAAELAHIEQKIGTLHALQINGGVWAFKRNKRVQAFFRRWIREWEKYAGRDQGALLRALYADPLKVFWLGNEWNTFEKYCKGITTAGVMHYPGKARRWEGMIQGRIDGAAAWQAVKRFEQKRRTGTVRGSRRR